MRIPRLLRAAVFVLSGALAALAAGCEPDAHARLKRARDFVYEKKADSALREYRAALDAIDRDDSPEAVVLRARALKGAADVLYLELRDFPRAAEVYQELVRACPEAAESLEGRVHLADILHVHFRDARGAIAALTGAIERNAPDGAELSYRVSKLYFELGDYQQATVEARRVQTRYESSSFVDDALLLEAQALALMDGRGAESLRAMLSLVDRFPESPLAPIALFEAGKARAEAGEREEAIALWVKALAAHPDPSIVQESIAQVRRQIAEQMPVGVGRSAQAFDRHAPPAAARPVVHRTSVEALGGTPEEAARDRGD